MDLASGSNLQPGSLVSLACMSHGGFPEAEVQWLDGHVHTLNDNVATSRVASEEPPQRAQCPVGGAGAQQHLQLQAAQPTAGGTCLRHDDRWVSSMHLLRRSSIKLFLMHVLLLVRYLQSSFFQPRCLLTCLPS